MVYYNILVCAFLFHSISFENVVYKIVYLVFPSLIRLICIDHMKQLQSVKIIGSGFITIWTSE